MSIVNFSDTFVPAPVSSPPTKGWTTGNVVTPVAINTTVTGYPGIFPLVPHAHFSGTLTTDSIMLNQGENWNNPGQPLPNFNSALEFATRYNELAKLVTSLTVRAQEAIYDSNQRAILVRLLEQQLESATNTIAKLNKTITVLSEKLGDDRFTHIDFE